MRLTLFALFIIGILVLGCCWNMLWFIPCSIGILFSYIWIRPKTGKAPRRIDILFVSFVLYLLVNSLGDFTESSRKGVSPSETRQINDIGNSRELGIRNKTTTKALQDSLHCYRMEWYCSVRSKLLAAMTANSRLAKAKEILCVLRNKKECQRERAILRSQILRCETAISYLGGQDSIDDIVKETHRAAASTWQSLQGAANLSAFREIVRSAHVAKCNGQFDSLSTILEQIQETINHVSLAAAGRLIDVTAWSTATIFEDVNRAVLRGTINVNAIAPIVRTIESCRIVTDSLPADLECGTLESPPITDLSIARLDTQCDRGSLSSRSFTIESNSSLEIQNLQSSLPCVNRKGMQLCGVMRIGGKLRIFLDLTRYGLCDDYPVEVDISPGPKVKELTVPRYSLLLMSVPYEVHDMNGSCTVTLMDFPNPSTAKADTAIWIEMLPRTYIARNPIFYRFRGYLANPTPFSGLGAFLLSALIEGLLASGFTKGVNNSGDTSTT